MKSSRFLRLFGKDAKDEAMISDAGIPVETRLPVYAQWYEADEARLGKDCTLMTNSSIAFECRKMLDARLSFTVTAGEQQVVIFCPYNYPIAPPEAFFIGESVPSGILDGNRKIDLFADEGFEWTTDTYIRDVVQRIEAIILANHGHQTHEESH
jgi:hypothetical protein